MTTLAFDGRYLASDGRATNGSVITGKAAKKVFLIKGVLRGEGTEFLFAGAGGFATLQLVKNWLEDGNDPFSNDPEQSVPQIEPNTFEAILVTKEKEVFDLESTLIPMPGESPCMGGSGGVFAIAAMLAGKNAAQAVQVAAELDIGSGGKIGVFDTEAWEFVNPEDLL